MKLNYLSLILNVVLIVFIVLFLWKDLSFSKIKSKLSSSNSDQKYSDIYMDRESLFKELKIDKDSIVFLGDSITHGIEVNELFDNADVKNRGINGDDIKNATDRISTITKGKPKKIFILLGTNNLTGEPNLDDMFNDYKNMVNTIRKESPETKIYVQSVLPVNDKNWKNNKYQPGFATRKQSNDIINKFNEKLEKLNQEEHVKYLDLTKGFKDSNGNLKENLTTDGLHLNGNGAIEWKNQLESFVTE